MGDTWTDTCKKNNNLVLGQSQEVIDEMQGNGMGFNVQGNYSVIKNVPLIYSLFERILHEQERS